MGGFARILKSIIAVLEELEAVRGLPTLLPELQRNNLVFNSDVCDRAVKNLHSRFSKNISHADQVLASMAKTVEHVSKLAQDAQYPEAAREYLFDVGRAMAQLVESRKTILANIRNLDTLSFSKNFDQLSFYLVLVGETSEEFIPQTCWRRGVPRTLGGIRENEGGAIFF